MGRRAVESNWMLGVVVVGGIVVVVAAAVAGEGVPYHPVGYGTTKAH